MLPELQLGAWVVSTYTLAYVLAALAGDASSALRLRRLGLPHLVLLRIVLVVTVLGFAGAYLVRVVPTVQRALQTGVWRWYGGSSYIGGLLAGIGALVLLCRWQRVPVLRALDAVLPTLALAQAIGRLGCFAAGCCYGRPTTSWLGVYLPDNAGNWAVRYPTQLLSAGANLLIFGLLLAVERRLPVRRDGVLAALYGALYCLERFVNEALRADAVPLFQGAETALSWAQLYTLVGLALALGWLVWQAFRGRVARA